MAKNMVLIIVATVVDCKYSDNERETSSILEYFSLRVQDIFEFTSKIAINHRKV